MKKRKRIALILVVVMLAQIVLSGVCTPVMVYAKDGSGGEIHNRNIASTVSGSVVTTVTPENSMGVYSTNGSLTVDCLNENFSNIDIRPEPIDGVEPFSKLEVNFGVNANGKINVRFDADVNYDYIVKVLDKFNIAPNEEIPDTVDKMGFSLTLDESYFTMIDWSVFDTDVKVDNGTIVGNYTIVNNGGNYILSCDMLPIAYKYYDIKAGKEFQFDLTNNAAAGSTVIFSLQEGLLKLDIIGPTPTPMPTATPIPHPLANYNINKSASVVNGTAFTYTITAMASGEDTLNGMSISDNIPSDLIVESVKILHDNILITKDVLEDGDIPVYTLSDNYFTYMIGNVDDESDIKQVTIELKVVLSQAAYASHMGGKNDFTFTNSCDLKSNDYPNEPLKSNTVKTDINFSDFLNKEGGMVGYNALLYYWTVKANTYFTGNNANVYIIDYISDSSIHNYSITKELILNKKVIGVNSISAPINLVPYAEMDSSHINYLDELFQEDRKCVTYTYPEGGKTAAVMIIKLDADDLNKPLSFSYYTEVNAVTGKNKKVENDAKIVWDEWFYFDGTGPGIGWSPEYGYANIEKDNTSPNTNLLNKTTGGYDESNQIVTWNFNLNRSGNNLTNVIVVDTITLGEQEFSDGVSTFGDGSTIPISVRKYDRTSKDLEETKNVDANISIHGSEIILSLPLGDITSNDYFEFSIKTKVTNPAILTNQGESIGTQANSATVEANEISAPVAGESDPNESNASQLISNTLLDKKLIAGYDFTTNSITWEVTINPNKLPISNMKLTDILPTGTEFGEIVNVTINGTVVSSGSYGFSLNHTSSAYDGNEETVFDFGDSSDKYVIRYTTIYKTEYRLEKFRPEKTITALNKVTLTGELVNTASTAEKAISLYADANHSFTPAPLIKTGKAYNYTGYKHVDWGYDDNRASYITWSILLNRNRDDFTDVVISDNLAKHFDLVAESMKVYEITEFNPDGTFKTKQDVTAGLIAGFIKLDNSGFEFKMPSGNDAKKAYLFEFDTLITDEAPASEMKNEINLTYEDGENHLIANKNVADVSSFSFTEYSKGLQAPYLQLYKTSSNTTYTANGIPNTLLPGAVFELSELVYDSSANEWVPKGEPRIKTTDGSKPINYLMIRKNTELVRKTLYKLEETVVPDGYQKPEPIYFAFGYAPDHTDGLNVEVFGSDVGGKVYILENKPLVGANDIVFFKYSEEDVPLPNVEFTISKSGLKTQTATSDSDGKVTFKDVDPGEYTITETVTPTGFTTVVPFKAMVTKSTGTLEFTLEGYNKTSDGKYIVQNSYTRGGITINKSHDEYSFSPDTKVSGAVFGIYNSSDTLVAYLTEGTTGSGVYNALSRTLNGYSEIADEKISGGTMDKASYLSNGKLLLGTYYAVELAVPDGYGLVMDDQDNTKAKKYPIVLNAVNGITINATNIWLKGTVSGKVYKANGNGLSDVWVGLFPDNETDYTEENIYNQEFMSGKASEHYPVITPQAMVKTDADGNYTFTGIPYGNYKVAQVTDKELPDYYEPNDTVYNNVTLTNSNQTVTSLDFTQTFEYRPIALNLFGYNENLLGIDTDKRYIPDAEFEIYADDVKVGYIHYNGSEYVLSDKDKNGNHQVFATVDETKPYLQKMNDSNDNRFYLLNGDYTIVQKSTGTEYKIPVDENGEKIATPFIVEITSIDETQKIDIINIFSNGTITGRFQDDNNNDVGGWVGIFKPGETVFTEENLYTKIPVDGVADGYVILNIDDVVRQSGTSGFEFTNLPPGEYKIAEIVPKDGKYPSPPGLTYGGGHSNVNITDDVPNAVIADAIKPYSRYKEVGLTLKAYDYMNDVEVTSFTNPYFMIYDGTEMVAFLIKDAVSGAYALSNTNGSVTLDKINAAGLPYFEYITDKGVFRLLEGNYTFIQAEADADYTAPTDMNGNPYNYELTIPDYGTKVYKEAYNYQTIGSVSGSVISKRDHTEVLGDVFVGIFPAGTTEFTTDNLCSMIEVNPGEYISINAVMASNATGGFYFDKLLKGDYIIAAVSDAATRSGYFTDEAFYDVNILNHVGVSDIDLITPFELESMYQTVSLNLKAFNLSSISPSKDNPLPLEDSEFAVINDDGIIVAYLVDDNNGRYVLSRTSSVHAQLPLDEINEDLGIPYFKNEAGSLQLLAGNYTIVQTAVAAGYYELSDAAGEPMEYQFNITRDASGLLSKIDKEVENVWADGAVSGQVIKSNDYPLEGVWLGLFPKGTTAFTAANLMTSMSFTTSMGVNAFVNLDTYAVQTNAAGEFSFPYLPAGEFVIAPIVPDLVYTEIDGFRQISSMISSAAGTQDSYFISVDITDDIENDFTNDAFIQLSRYGLVDFKLVSLYDDTIEVPDAEFMVYNSAGIPIAYLIDDGNGSYILSNQNSQGMNLLNVMSQSSGRPYLMYDSDDGLFRLLDEETDYYIEQQNEPDKYLAILEDGSLNTGVSTAARSKYMLNSVADNYAGGSSGMPVLAKNAYAPGEVSGKAVSKGNEPLSDAWIGIFPVGTTEFTEENAFYPFKQTDAAGSFYFSKLPEGDYVIAVIQSPAGYNDDIEAIEISISENGTVSNQIEDIVFTKPVQGGFPGGNGGNGGYGGGNVYYGTVKPSASINIRLTASNGNVSGYSLRLVGDEDEWTFELNTDGTVSFKDVPFGTYEAKLLDEEGNVIATQTIDVNTLSGNVEFYIEGAVFKEEDLESEESESKDDHNENDDNTVTEESSLIDEIITDNGTTEDNDVTDGSDENSLSGGTEDKELESAEGSGLSDGSYEKNSTGKTPQTGDSSIPNPLLIIMMILSLIGAGMVIVKKKSHI